MQTERTGARVCIIHLTWKQILTARILSRTPIIHENNWRYFYLYSDDRPIASPGKSEASKEESVNTQERPESRESRAKRHERLHRKAEIQREREQQRAHRDAR